ncbi:pol polyprotein [Trichonephila clavipes]|nr:pol polyprotein [Trichonephila clavipes]
MYHATEKWTEILPTILLGFRAALKENLGCTSAELVYGKTLRLPGEFFIATKVASDPVQFGERLRAHTCSIYNPNPHVREVNKLFLCTANYTSVHVFVRRDSVRRPLQAPYDGPYPVIKRSDKFYKVNIHGKPTSISIDRLKPAFTDNVDDILHLEESDAETKPNLRKTRSGHRVHFPDYFVSSR